MLLKQASNVPAPHQMSSAAGGARGREVIDAAKSNKIKSVAGPMHFHPKAVELTGGSCIPVDTVIMATGYQPCFI